MIKKKFKIPEDMRYVYLRAETELQNAISNLSFMLNTSCLDEDKEFLFSDTYKEMENEIVSKLLEERITLIGIIAYVSADENLNLNIGQIKAYDKEGDIFLEANVN